MEARGPEGWVEREAGSLGRVKGGKRLPMGYSLTSVVTPHPYLRVVDMCPGGVDTSDLRYVPPVAASAIRNYRISRDDVFISVAGTLGIVGRIPPELDGANLTENADRITSISCDPDYLMYYLMSERIQAEIEAIRTVGAQPKLALGRIKKFRIRVPLDRDEQVRISSALRNIDRLIGSLEELLIKKVGVREGLAGRLLGGETRIPGFRDPWPERRLGDLGTFLKGRGIRRADIRDSGVGCIRYGELYTTYRDYTDSTVSFVAPEVAAGALSLRRGDLLFAASGETREEIGTCVAFVGTQATVGGGDIVVLRGADANPVFLSLLMNAPPVVAKKARLGQGDAVVHISLRSLESIAIKLPPRAEQDAIAGVLISVDDEIRASETRLEKFRALRTGMMQELLSGRSRMPVKEPTGT